MEQFRLMMRGISKSYGNAAALQNVDFSVRPGEVHALIGENGAGKSTLLNILSGVRGADSGGDQRQWKPGADPQSAQRPSGRDRDDPPGVTACA
ncbi:Galactose/methyl galactoside import ATP-binding protein MglA [Pantoea agglomerans]|uniref:Galactose/methyl galactoside import ATP-binding protein MglA n=1 Tax=Enterobacter agglomerans TaxID=549 RepID=A0A379AH26_ENTAG|nr:Galactose/methyl galactoside import ATP-binding protein MglA [Pantoea agglomerans]